MTRWIWFAVCVVFGLLLLVGGLLVPLHLRAVDVSVVEKAGRGTPGLVEQGLALVGAQKLGAAQLLLRSAQETGLSHLEKLGLAVTNLAAQHPEWQVWGGAEPRLESRFGRISKPPGTGPEPFIEFVVRRENRAAALELLRASSQPAAQELLRCRALTNTIVFSPAPSSSGQVLDAALSVCGLLLVEGCLSTGLSNTVLATASDANLGGSSQPVEQVLLDLMTLGQRFNWGQLVAFVGPVDDAETLRLLANLVRKSDTGLPVLFAAIQLSHQPAEVAKYLMKFSETGLNDLGASLRFGVGGLNELLRHGQRLHESNFRRRVVQVASLGQPFDAVLDFCWRMPWIALTVKWLLYVAGGFGLAAALHFGRPAVSALERPLQVRGFHLAREFLFALGFLLVVLLLSEPFLAQEGQKVEFPFRLRLPTVGSAVPAGATGAHASLMNQLSLLTLLLFFVLQALIYTACLIKLAEIRRQHVPPRLKLKLLENEEHLFDAGLYLGFAGTIVSLILVSLGVIKPSLMAAYSSTSFGIIFVSVFKIFHLRPLRRILLLESEAALPEPVDATPATTPSLVTPL